VLVETKSHVLLGFGLYIPKSKIGPVKWLPVSVGCLFNCKLKEQLHVQVAVAFDLQIFFAVSALLQRAISSLCLSLESVPFSCHVAPPGPAALMSPVFRER